MSEAEDFYYNHIGYHALPRLPVRPTYNLDTDGGGVLTVLNLDFNLVFTRVMPLSRSDEQDGVGLTVSDANLFWIDRLPVFQPGDQRARFSLYPKK